MSDNVTDPSATAIVFDPQGVPRDVPYEQVHAAVQAGGVPGVRMQAPDGKIRVVPANRYQEAVQAGGKVVPMQSDLQVDTSDEALHANEMELSQQYGRGFGFAAGGGIKNVAAATPSIVQAVKAGLSTARPALANAARSAAEAGNGTVAEDVLGMASPRFKHAQRILARVASWLEPEAEAAPAPQYKTAAGPATPDPALLQGNALGKLPPTGALPASQTGEALAAIKQTAPPSPTPAAEVESAIRPEAVEARSQPAARPIHGESALTQILTGQDNANLLKIAKSRGIDVAKEAMLKPGKADLPIIRKIIASYAPDELQEIGSQYLENTRFRHSFGDIGKEAWKTLSLKSYFPDLKIPEAQLRRTQAAIQAVVQSALPAVSQGEDLTPQLDESLRQALAKKAAQ